MLKKGENDNINILYNWEKINVSEKYARTSGILSLLLYVSWYYHARAWLRDWVNFLIFNCSVIREKGTKDLWGGQWDQNTTYLIN